MAADKIGAEKARLRAELLAARRARPAAQLSADRLAVREQVARQLSGSAAVAAYVPLATEPGSPELLAMLAQRSERVLVPVLLPSRDLDWAQWSPSGLGPPLGVGAIAQARLVLVPALAVARDGTRLGRGGGSYDRALARCPAGAVLAALLFDGEIVDRLPADSWDVPVTAAVTPSGWTQLGNPGVRFDR